MIHLLLAASVICSGMIPTGIHNVDIVAKYQHEATDSSHYVYYGSDICVGPGEVTVAAEGWPYYVEASIQGVPVAKCSYDPAILIDGFNDGTTGAWSYATP